MNKRLERLQNKLREEEKGGILISCEINQSYISGFDFTDGYVLVFPNKAYIITDSRYVEAAEKACAEDFSVLSGVPMLKTINDLVFENGAKELLFEDLSLSYADYIRIKEAVSLPLTPAGTLLTDMRELKDAEEIAKTEKAQEITDLAFAHILKTVTPEMTEIDVAVELEFFMRKQGASGKSFDIIAVSGDASSLPHGVPRNVKLKKGFLTMDFGCVYEGYCSDMTRTVCLGKADEEMKRLYNTVYDAQRLALNVMRGGMLCSDVDKVARDRIYEEYEGYFGHGLGHGVGREIHEAPRLSMKAGDAVLRDGHIVTCEPGIYLPGKFGCRIEDMVVIENGVARDITKSPKELIELF